MLEESRIGCWLVGETDSGEGILACQRFGHCEQRTDLGHGGEGIDGGRSLRR